MSRRNDRRDDSKLLCNQCGRLGHRQSNCKNKKQYSSTVKCYQCQQHVVSLKDHKRVCQPSSTVECFGCGKRAVNLRSHKNECVGSSSAVVEKKAQLKVESFGETRDFYLLLDVSSSMEGRRLADAKATLRGLFTKMPEEDRIAIITFDSKAFFKLKPRPVGQIKRQNELDACLDRIFARGATAVWDAIHMGVEQVRDPSRSTLFIVLTDGEDNCSRHTLGECEMLVSAYPNISFNLVHIEGRGARNAQYEHLVSRSARGRYFVVPESHVVETVTTIFDEYYAAPPNVAGEQADGASAPSLADLTK